MAKKSEEKVEAKEKKLASSENEKVNEKEVKKAIEEKPKTKKDKKPVKKAEKEKVMEIDKEAESTEEVEKPEKEAKKDKTEKTETHKKVVLTPKKYRHGKLHREAEKLIEKGKEYSLEEAISLLKKTKVGKFDSTVEIHTNLNIDPSNADHQIRGSVSLPAGLGKSKKVVAIVNPDAEKEAKAAGAETVGGQEIIGKIEKGWLDFEVVVATPDMMPHLGKIGKILGTKGLMPNPKTGTVTAEPGKVITDIKRGRAEYKIDKEGNLHSAVGKISFSEADLLKNIEAYMEAIHHSKPASLKGSFIKSTYLTTTMGPSVKIIK